MSEVKKDFYQEIAEANEGVAAKNVKSIFLWYDLLSFSLAFQLFYVISSALKINFSATIFSAVAIVITDTMVKLFLMKDGKNYQKLKGQLALVKLWTIPLMALAAVVLIALVCITFGLI